MVPNSNLNSQQFGVPVDKDEASRSEIQNLKERLSIVEDLLRKHTHSNRDGTSVIDSTIAMQYPEFLDLGFMIFSSQTIKGTDYGSINVGREKSTENPGTTQNSQFTIQHGAADTFIYGFRPPLYLSKNTVSITNGGNTLSDSGFIWATDELAGAYVVLTSSDGETIYEVRTIASNSATQLQISSTWSSATASTYKYVIFKPVYLGTANYPFKRMYTDEGTGGGIRFGLGATWTSGTAQNGLLYMDATGDLYWRNKSGTSTKLN